MNETMDERGASSRSNIKIKECPFELDIGNESDD